MNKAIRYASYGAVSMLIGLGLLSLPSLFGYPLARDDPEYALSICMKQIEQGGVPLDSIAALTAVGGLILYFIRRT